MSAQFDSASSQKLLNSAAPVMAYPFSVGMWVYPTQTAATQTFWSYADTAAGTNYFELSQASQWNVAQTDDATPLVTSVGTVTANRWFYVLCRFISATSRRISILNPNTGVASHAQSTTSDTPVGMDAMAFGCRNHNAPTSFFTGSVAEAWYTNTDIQPGDVLLEDRLLRQLAYGGPFSVPHIAKDIMEYRSFRSTLDSNAEDWREIYWGNGAKQTWTNTNGVTIGPHPPLPGSYVKMSRPYRTRAHKMIRSPLIIPAAMAAADPPNRPLWRNSLMMMGAGR